MRNLFKSRILLILFITCSLIGGLGFSHPTQQTYAATSTSSSKQLTINSFGTYCLFPNNNNITDIDDYFGYYCADENARKTGNTDMLEHRSGKAVVGSYKVGHFYSDIMLPQNYINAGKNGALVISSAAYLSSEDNPFWGVSLDSYVEDVIMELSVGTGTVNSYEGYTASSSTSVTEKKPRQFVYRTIENWVPSTMGNFIRLHFYTKEASCNNVIMKIKSPNITLSTNDTTNPSIKSYTYDSATRYASDKYVYINVEDSGSGIDYVKVNGVVATLHSKSADTKTSTYKFAVSGCNTYNIEVVDNVGNKTTDVYKTNKITTSVIGNGTITNDIYTFAGDTVTLTATANDGNIFVGYNLNGSFVETTQTNFDVVVNGDQTVVAYFKIIADFVLNKTEYLYTGSELQLDYTLSPDLPVTITYTKNENTVQFKEVGEYKVNVNINTDEYYYNNTFTVVVNRQVNITVDDANVTYNGKAQGIKVTTDCTVNYDVVYTLDGEIIPAENVVDAGTYNYTVTINQQYYFGSVSGTFTIDVKEVSISLQDLSYTYDATEKQATVICDYDYSITYNGNVDLPKNAGNYTVNAQVTAKNYVGSVSGTLSIAVRKATITADNKTTVYGQELLELTYTVQNLVDNLTITLESAIENKVGSYTITVNPVTNSNYEFTYINGTYTITPKEITVVCATNQSKIYGEQDPQLVYQVEQGMLIAGDTLTGSIVREPGEDAGQYAIKQGTLNNDNYEIEFVEGVFSILARRVVVKIDSLTKMYGEADNVFTYQPVYGSFIENITLDITRDAGETVGEYKIYLNEFDNSNYDLTVLDGSLTINARPLTITANAVSTNYGTEAELTYQITQGDLVGEDTLIGNLTREPGNNVGTYKITVGTLAISNTNYDITFVGSDYQINKFPITIEAVGNGKIYGQKDAEIAYQITDGALIGEDVLFGSLTRLAGEDAGQYAISLNTLNNDNYDITLTPSYYTISKKSITITAYPKVKTYGEADTVLTYQVDGLLGLDIVSVNLTREAGEDAGEYKILLDNFVNKNYYVEKFNSAIYTIKNADINLNIANASFVYNGLVHTLDTSSYSNFNHTIVYKDSNGLEVAEPINADTYTATISFANNKNYNDKNYTANLVIQKQFVSITIDTELFIYNGQNIYPTYYLNYDVNSYVNFEGEHSQIGIYDYTIIVNETNYYGEVSGKLEIIANPVYTNEQGDSLVYVSDKFDKNATVIIGADHEKNSLAQAEVTLKPVIKNIDVLGVYNFEASNSEIVNSNYMANFKLENCDPEKVKVFEINELGYIRELDVTFEDGYASFKICDLNSTIFVTTENEIMKKALVGSGIGLVILLVTVFVIFGRKIALLSFINRIKARKKKKQEQSHAK